MDLNRRSFLRGMFTVAALSVAPALAIHADLPRIVGDGVHDDAPGFQAALEGKPFQCDGHIVRLPSVLSVRGGVYHIGSTIHVRDVPIVITDCRFVGSPAGHMWYFHDRPAGAPVSYLANCIFECQPSGAALAFGAAA